MKFGDWLGLLGLAATLTLLWSLRGGVILIVAAVAYTAALLQPLPIGLLQNVLFAVVLSGLVVAFETRLRVTPPSLVLGALLGACLGCPLIGKAEAAALPSAAAGPPVAARPSSFRFDPKAYTPAILRRLGEARVLERISLALEEGRSIAMPCPLHDFVPQVARGAWRG